jgi:predicted MFS family arabinose efflux permease
MKKRLSTFCLLFTIVVVSFISFILPGNNITKMIFLGTLSFIFGIYISTTASKKKCKKVGKVQSVFHGILTSGISLGTWILNISLLNKPIHIFIKHDKMAKYIGALIYIFLALRWITRRNYDKSIEKVCSLCYTGMVDNLKKYNEYLEKVPESINKDIEVRD